MPADLTLPARVGAPPTTNVGMPHTQLDQNAPADVFDALAAWLFSLPHVEERRSRVSLPSSRAAWIADDVALSDRLADREFTHLHQDPGPGSQHLGLPTADGEVALSQGWAEPHPIDGMKPGVRYLMIYAPRDAQELEAIKTIVRRCYDWTLGAAAPASRSSS